MQIKIPGSPIAILTIVLTAISIWAVDIFFPSFGPVELWEKKGGWSAIWVGLTMCFIVNILCWHFLHSVQSRIFGDKLVSEFMNLRPHINMLKELENPTYIPYRNMQEMHDLLLTHNQELPGAMCSLNTIDTSGAHAWVSNGILQYEGILSSWAKRQLIESSFYQGYLSHLDDIWPPYYLFSEDENEQDLIFITLKGRGRIMLSGKIERIFIWSLEDITSKLGSTILGFHKQRCHPTYILPKDFTTRKYKDFVIWDVELPCPLAAKNPRIPRNPIEIYGLEKIDKTNDDTAQKQEARAGTVDWDYIDLDRRNSLKDLWKDLLELSIDVEFIEINAKTGETLAEKISFFDYHAEMKKKLGCIREDAHKYSLLYHL